VIRTAAAAAVLALVAAGCGGSRSIAAQTGDNVAKIHSGVLDLRVLIAPHGSAQPFGFELRGPFSVRPGRLPVARIAYTQIANGTSATARFVADGRHVWIVSADGTRRLPREQARAFALGDVFTGLDIGSWIDHPTVTGAGPDLDRVRGRVDVVALMNGIAELAPLAKREVPRVAGDDAKRLRAALRSSHAELLTTKRGRMLRRLDVAADLGFDVPARLRPALGGDVGARLELRFAVARPNSRVVVHAP
jgi:hypothetical protein